MKLICITFGLLDIFCQYSFCFWPANVRHGPGWMLYLTKVDCHSGESSKSHKYRCVKVIDVLSSHICAFIYKFELWIYWENVNVVFLTFSLSGIYIWLRSCKKWYKFMSYVNMDLIIINGILKNIFCIKNLKD